MILPPAVRRPLLVVAPVATAGALVALFGGIGLVGVSGFLGVGLVRGVRSGDLGAVDRAISRHVDPGADLREAADDRARSVLARPRYEDWAVVVVLLAVGIACLVVAWLRRDGWPAAPGAVLVALAPVLWVLDRRGLLAASRWLDSPPHDGQPA